ncbi:hypothetical protein [Chryseobacterium proteolyticum]|uniref:hypothetical protein n=1 Tax=Chryseobacterium proteolyticum TaxID=118127 RepID=UPI0039835B3B
MEKNFTLTGGARIGLANANYPFADLYVDADILKINASLVGNLVFQPQDIISIKPYTLIPLIGQGIKIYHRVEKYNSNVIFWTFRDPAGIINEIEKTGFLAAKANTAPPKNYTIIEQQMQGGFPLKPLVPILLIIAWNALFLYDFLPHSGNKNTLQTFPGTGVCSALGLVFITALLSLISNGFRRLILKKGRSFENIKKFSIFILGITGFMLIVFLAIGTVN